MTLIHSGIPDTESGKGHEKGWNYFLNIFPGNLELARVRRNKFEASLMSSTSGKLTQTRGYAPVNGLKMYYEIEGAGDPLVCIPPAFGHAGVNSFPELVQSHSVITVDLQGHGRTADIPERPIRFEQHARDVVGLLKYLGIAKADFFGESFGGVIATMIAVRYPDRVGRVATYGATFGPAGCRQIGSSAAPGCPDT